MKLMVTLKILLCTPFFFLPCRSIPKALRDGQVYLEYFNNKAGSYINVYDYELDTDTYEEFDVENELACRLIQIVTEAKLASVGQDDPAQPFKCRIKRNEVWRKYKFQPKAGHFSFIAHSPQEPGKFAPASDGFVYWSSPTKIEKNAAENCCSPLSRRPLLKSDKQKEVLLAYMNENGLDRAFIGAHKDNPNSQTFWDDKTTVEIYVSENYNNKGNVVMKPDGEIYYSRRSAYCVCIINIFSLPWDY